MASQLSVDYASGANVVDALRKLQIIVDGAVAPRTDIRAIDQTTFASLSFPDDVPAEQVSACFRAAVNLAGLPESPFVAGSPALSGAVSSGSEQREYSV